MKKERRRRRRRLFPISAARGNLFFFDPVMRARSKAPQGSILVPRRRSRHLAAWRGEREQARTRSGGDAAEKKMEGCLGGGGGGGRSRRSSKESPRGGWRLTAASTERNDPIRASKWLASVHRRRARNGKEASESEERGPSDERERGSRACCCCSTRPDSPALSCFLPIAREISGPVRAGEMKGSRSSVPCVWLSPFFFEQKREKVEAEKEEE